MVRQSALIHQGLDFVLKTEPEILAKYGLCFLTDISVVSGRVVGKECCATSNIPFELYQKLKRQAYQDVLAKLEEGKFRRTEHTSGLPIRTFSHLHTTDSRESCFNDHGVFYPTLTITMKGRGYVPREHLISSFSRGINPNPKDKRIKGMHPRFSFDVITPEDLDLLEDDPEVERMLRDSEKEYIEFLSSTCLTRGEHPTSKFLTHEKGYQPGYEL